MIDLGYKGRRYLIDNKESEYLILDLLADNKRLSQEVKKVTIITQFIKPPIPTRKYDWQATRSDYNEGDPIGYGETELEAIQNLIDQEDE